MSPIELLQQPLYLVTVWHGPRTKDRPQAMTARDVWVNAEWLAINGGLVTLVVEPIS